MGDGEAAGQVELQRTNGAVAQAVADATGWMISRPPSAVSCNSTPDAIRAVTGFADFAVGMGVGVSQLAFQLKVLANQSAYVASSCESWRVPQGRLLPALLAVIEANTALLLN